MEKPQPHNQLLYFYAALACITVLFLIPWIAGYGFADSDSLGFYYPAFSFFSEALRAGHSVLWSPYLLSGFPLYADLIGGFLNPLSTLLYRLIPNFIYAYHALFLINVLIASACVYWLARALDISPRGAWIGALVFATSQWVLARATIPPVYFTLPVLPGLLLTIEYTFRKSRQWLILGVYVLGISLLAGHAQLTLLSLTTAGLWALSRMKLYRTTFPKVIITMTILCAGGLIIGAPYLIPAYHLKQLSERSTPLSLAISQQEGLSLLDPLHLIFPSARLLFPWLSSSESFLFIGTLPFLLMCLAIFSKTQEPAKKLLTTGLCLALAASVIYSPIGIALHYLPVFNWFRVPSRWLYIAVTLAALLAGQGADVLTRPDPNRKKIIYIVGSVIGICIACSLGLSLFHEDIIDVLQTLHVKLQTAGMIQALPEHAWRVIIFLINTLRESISLLNPAIIITIVGWIVGIWFMAAAPKINEQRIRILLPSIILFGSFVSIVTLPSGIKRSEITKPSLITEFIGKNLRPGYRVFSYLGKEALWEQELLTGRMNRAGTVQWHNLSLHGNTGLLFKIPMTTGYSSVATERQRIFASELGTAWMIPLRDQREIRFSPEDHINQRLNLLQISSTQYVLSPYPIDNPRLELRLETANQHIPLYLYELSNPYPHVFSPEQIICVADKNEAMEALLESTDSPYIGVIEMSPCPWETANQPPEKISISKVDIAPGLVSFTVTSEIPSWVIINQSYVPGWHAYVNGEKTDVHLANLLFQKIWILPGTSEVIVLFEGINQ